MPSRLFPGIFIPFLRHIKLLGFIILISLQLPAQIQWYQNQDGNNPWPYGTIATTIRPLNSSTFIACYQWSVNNDQFTWKISKTNTAGQELRAFYVTGTTAIVEAKTGHNAVYVFQRDFPVGLAPQYKIYKLDFNLNVLDQKNIALPSGFNIFTMNAFELDKNDNLYLAGDGMYPDGGGYSPASFIIKSDKNLVAKWTKMDSTQTSYSRIHIDNQGYVIVINDHYSFFPDVKVKVISSNGQISFTKTIATDPNRYSLASTLDDHDNLLLYGVKSSSDTTQSVFLYKISRTSGEVAYRKDLFESMGTQLMDLKMGEDGHIYTLVQQYFNPGIQMSKVSRFNPANGYIYWNTPYLFDTDSCNLTRLVMNNGSRFYAVGERRSNMWYSKAYTARIKTNGVKDGNFVSPDSVCFQRSHWLSDGIMDQDDRLIAIGGTMDLDTVTFMNTYLRAFAVRYGNGNGNGVNSDGKSMTAFASEEAIADASVSAGKFMVYPNPVQNQLVVTGMNAEDFKQIAVYNIQGALVVKQSVENTTAFINTSTWKNGTYLLVIRSADGSNNKSTRFTVSH